ncbi:MAG: type IV pilus biogenesis protein PilM [Methylococcaceae bacterium]
MTPPWHTQTPAVLGLDIGTTGIRLLELSGNPTACRVNRYAYVPYPAALTDQAISTCIQHALKRSGTKTRLAALAIPNAESITKSISLPAGLSGHELLARVELEADQHLPYTLDELYWDFTVKESSTDSTDPKEILVVASQRAYVEDRIALAERAGLQVKLVDMERYAMENAMRSQYARSGHACERLAVLYIEGETSRFTLFHPQEHTSAHELRAGVNTHTDAPFDDLIKAIQRILKTHGSKPVTGIERLVLAGEISAWPELKPCLETAFNIPTEHANPLIGMNMESIENRELLKQNAPAFLIASGLALRVFDP